MEYTMEIRITHVNVLRAVLFACMFGNEQTGCTEYKEINSTKRWTLTHLNEVTLY